MRYGPLTAITRWSYYCFKLCWLAAEVHMGPLDATAILDQLYRVAEILLAASSIYALTRKDQRTDPRTPRSSSLKKNLNLVV